MEKEWWCMIHYILNWPQSITTNYWWFNLWFSYFENKSFVKQNWLRGWDNLHGGCSHSTWIWYGNDESLKSYILWEIGFFTSLFFLCFLFCCEFYFFAFVLSLCFHSRFSCLFFLSYVGRIIRLINI